MARKRAPIIDDSDVDGFVNQFLGPLLAPSAKKNTPEARAKLVGQIVDLHCQVNGYSREYSRELVRRVRDRVLWKT